MPRYAAFSIPETALTMTTYKELGDLIAAFAGGALHLVVILAKPGLGKSQLVQQSVENTHAAYFKGRNTPIRFYIRCYEACDEPIVLDDCDSMLGDKLTRELIKNLTETDYQKLLQWESHSSALEENGVPYHFETASPVCIITNSWNSEDKICQAIESRAEFIHFCPTWHEVYRQAATWFDDQEIFDFVRDRIPILKEPDMRVLVKAKKRKEAKLPNLPWQKVIENHCDDSDGLLLRQLLADKTYKTNDARCAHWVETTGYHRATFYRRLKALETLGPLTIPARIVLRKRK